MEVIWKYEHGIDVNYWPANTITYNQQIEYYKSLLKKKLQ